MESFSFNGVVNVEVPNSETCLNLSEIYLTCGHLVKKTWCSHYFDWAAWNSANHRDAKECNRRDIPGKIAEWTRVHDAPCGWCADPPLIPPADAYVWTDGGTALTPALRARRLRFARRHTQQRRQARRIEKALKRARQVPGEDCSWCWMEKVRHAQFGGVVALRGCGHTFHEECAGLAISVNWNCPICMTNVPE